MAKAGFIYMPADDSADMVKCIHCNLALDGWEKGDDPGYFSLLNIAGYT